jgi:L-histidine Nalpha-methyltransferase
VNDGTTLDRLTSTELTAARATREQLAEDLAAALDEGRSIPPLHLYDARGSEIFERITQVDEYYLTSAEAEIISREADAVIAAVRPQEIVELGSGSSTKTGALLEAMQRAGTGHRYAALDVSTAALDEAAERLSREHPGLSIDSYTGDFHTDLTRIPRTGTRLLLFLGSTLGNMRPAERRSLLTAAVDSLEPGDAFLIGLDLVKDLNVLLPAYDDGEGVAAAFALNLLTVIDRELDADIPLDAFAYEAVWDPGEECVEMRLVATREVTATIGVLGRTVTFRAGDHLITEHSYKFRPERFTAELSTLGLTTRAIHTDEAGRFAVMLAQPTGG